MRIAIAGRSTLACLIAQSIVDNSSNSCLIIAEYEDEFLVNTGLNYVVVDYNNPAVLRHALQGLHVLISTSPGPHEKMLLREAVNARVHRFMPAHFDGLPQSCDQACPLDRHRTEMRALLAGHRAELQSCLLICGILYENFQPGGITTDGGNTDLFAFTNHPVDVQSMRAQIPPRVNEGTVCLTAAQDVAICIAKMLQTSYWPSEVRIYSERMTVENMLTSIERFKGQSFDRAEHDETLLRAALNSAVAKSDLRAQSRIHHMLSLSQGLLDFEENDMKGLDQNLTPLRFQDWLFATYIGGQPPVSPAALDTSSDSTTDFSSTASRRGRSRG